MQDIHFPALLELMRVEKFGHNMNMSRNNVHGIIYNSFFNGKGHEGPRKLFNQVAGTLLQRGP
jgi:hypothetical protein